MRLRKLKNVEERLSARSDLVIADAVQYKGKWKSFFNNDNPIYIEIGMGKGKFIIKHAMTNPEINYIGIEREASVLVKATEKVEEKPSNLIFINFDATDILDLFDDGEVDKIFLNFSDPWPKSRHSKRRLTYSSNLINYKRILKRNHSIEFKSDNRHLFEFSLRMFIANDFAIENLSLNLHEDYDDVITTEYEDKFIEKNNIIYYVEVQNGKNETI